MEKINSFSFLTIGKTQESKSTPEFSRYIGYSNSYVLAVNPTKAELEKIYGREMEKDPVYTGEDDKGKFVRIDFIVKTDPNDGGDLNKGIPGHGIETINHFMVTLRPTAAVSQDGTQVTVIDGYGNYALMPKEDAEAHKQPLSIHGKNLRVDTDYKIACGGQDILTHFVKTYLGMGCGFDYINGTWVKKANADDDKFAFDHLKNFFTGDVSEIREAIAIQPNNKIKLLYGVYTNDEGKQFQQVCTRAKYVLKSNAAAGSIAKMDADLREAYNRGSFSNVEYKVQPLQEYVVQPTNLAATTTDENQLMPWDN